MRRGSASRATLVGGLVGALVLAGAQSAAADPFERWSGRAGPYAWEGKRLSCGAAGEKPSQVRGHTRWRSSPSNGYQRLTFRRQVLNEDTGRWKTAQRRRLSTKNKGLEGTTGVLHWRFSFPTAAGQAGKISRYVAAFGWLRDRPGRDRLTFKSTKTLRPCVIGG